jgi:hypothetical protein
VASVCRIEVKLGNDLLYCPVTVTCGNANLLVPIALLDSGAAICHMTYRMWLDMGLHKLCWNGNQSAFKNKNIHDVDNVMFDDLPLRPNASIIGDGTEAKVYDFRIDKLELGMASKEFNSNIILNNITVSLIDGDNPEFTVGWNVIKYLKPLYDPAIPLDQSQDPPVIKPNYYDLELTNSGLMLLEFDRQMGFNNNLKNMFSYE